jgi:hypothetical protein
VRRALSLHALLTLYSTGAGRWGTAALCNSRGGLSISRQLTYREVGIATRSSGTGRWAHQLNVDQYREVGTAALCSSGTGRWAQQLYAAQVQGGGHSSSMQLRYREVGTAALCSSDTGMWAQQLYAAQVQRDGQSSSM